MRSHPFVQYAAYVIRHKWIFLKAAPRYGVPIGTALIHDWTRFLPSEFFPSANYFYGAYQRGVTWRRGESPSYDAARDLHESRNKHHAQYWHGQPMDDPSIREMLCDWDAAGQAKGNPIDDWYEANRDALGLHPATLARIDALLGHGTICSNANWKVQDIPASLKSITTMPSFSTALPTVKRRMLAGSRPSASGH